MLIKLFLIFLFLIRSQILIEKNNQDVETVKTKTEEKNTIKPANNTISTPINSKKNDEEVIGSLIIPTINLNKKLYNTSSKKNNIEENVTIIKSTQNPLENKSLIVLAAHSGNGPIAYFNDLNKLKIDDEIILNYYSKEYKYVIINIFEQKKNGYINIQNRNISQLILTTCSTKNKGKQLIIESTLKESES